MIHMGIDISEDKVVDFCRRWKITEFSLFGSVLRDDFRPDSDIDVLAAFAKDSEWDLYDLVYMQDELEAMFGRPVHLVDRDGLRNPFRRRSILSSRRVIYAA